MGRLSLGMVRKRVPMASDKDLPPDRIEIKDLRPTLPSWWSFTVVVMVDMTRSTAFPPTALNASVGAAMP